MMCLTYHGICLSSIENVFVSGLHIMRIVRVSPLHLKFSTESFGTRLRLGDILTLRDYKLKSWDQMKKNGITNAEYFLLMGIYNAIPKD